MTHLEQPATNNGFTLIETIIYVALFALLISGLLSSMMPFLSGAANTNAKVVVEGESAFAIRKINTILASSTCAIAVTPNSFTVTTYNGTLCTGDTYTVATSAKSFTVQKTSGGVPGAAVPFTADRVAVTMFTVKKVAAVNGFPTFIEFSFTLGGVTYGPIRKYFIL